MVDGCPMTEARAGECGASLVEYALIVTLVAIACLASVSALGIGVREGLEGGQRGPATDPGAVVATPADEVLCDGLDDDGDGWIDEGLRSTWYRDADGDGVGGSITTTACTAPPGYVGSTGDTDDDGASPAPGAGGNPGNGSPGNGNPGNGNPGNGNPGNGNPGNGGKAGK